MIIYVDNDSYDLTALTALVVHAADSFIGFALDIVGEVVNSGERS